ncbi:MAG: hypothetical protein O7E51_09050 [Acidobacteria bacterium]|nr:hypothetical protein [Acidobacteriota bacterium]
MSRYPEFTLAAVQAAPVLFDAEASKVKSRAIKENGKEEDKDEDEKTDIT